MGRNQLTVRGILATSLVVILIGSTSITATGELDAAVENYYNGYYEAAAEIYESVIMQNLTNYAIYLNLGNAYYHSGFQGRALLNYRRAQEQHPRHETISQNIARIRAERATFQGSERAIIDRMASSSTEVLSLRELANFSLMLWATFFAAGYFFLGFSTRSQRIKVGLITLGLITVLCNTLLFTRLYTLYQRPGAVVVSVSANVYSGPGNNYLVIGKLYSATELRVVARSGVWRKFVLPNGDKGWITSDKIEEV